MLSEAWHCTLCSPARHDHEQWHGHPHDLPACHSHDLSAPALLLPLPRCSGALQQFKQSSLAYLILLNHQQQSQQQQQQQRQQQQQHALGSPSSLDPAPASYAPASTPELALESASAPASAPASASRPSTTAPQGDLATSDATAAPNVCAPSPAAPQHGMTVSQLARKAERLLRDRAQLQVRFDADEAAAELLRLGLARLLVPKQLDPGELGERQQLGPAGQQQAVSAARQEDRRNGGCAAEGLDSGRGSEHERGAGKGLGGGGMSPCSGMGPLGRMEGTQGWAEGGASEGGEGKNNLLASTVSTLGLLQEGSAKRVQVEMAEVGAGASAGGVAAATTGQAAVATARTVLEALSEPSSAPAPAPVWQAGEAELRLEACPVGEGIGHLQTHWDALLWARVDSILREFNR